MLQRASDRVGEKRNALAKVPSAPHRISRAFYDRTRVPLARKTMLLSRRSNDSILSLPYDSPTVLTSVVPPFHLVPFVRFQLSTSVASSADGSICPSEPQPRPTWTRRLRSSPPFSSNRPSTLPVRSETNYPRDDSRDRRTELLVRRW